MLLYIPTVYLDRHLNEMSASIYKISENEEGLVVKKVFLRGMSRNPQGITTPIRNAGDDYLGICKTGRIVCYKTKNGHQTKPTNARLVWLEMACVPGIFDSFAEAMACLNLQPKDSWQIIYKEQTLACLAEMQHTRILFDEGVPENIEWDLSFVVQKDDEDSDSPVEEDAPVVENEEK